MRPSSGRAARVASRAALFAATALVTFSALRTIAGADGKGQVLGTVSVGERLRGRTGKIIVYLEPADGRAVSQPPGPRRTISQKDAKFHPSFAHLAVGDSVEFKNDEESDLEHNVFSASDTKPFDLGLYGKGLARTVVFDKPGEVAIYCSIHKLMEATVYVVPTPFRAEVDEKTLSFVIADVPAGKWRARTWTSSKRCPNASAEIELPAGGSARLDLALGKKGG